MDTAVFRKFPFYLYFEPRTEQGDDKGRGRDVLHDDRQEDHHCQQHRDGQGDLLSTLGRQHKHHGVRESEHDARKQQVVQVEERLPP